MKTENIKELLDRVAAELGDYGNKDGKPTISDAAREMELPEKRVWEWVKKREKIPNGEATLRLLKWVEARKAERVAAEHAEKMRKTLSKLK